MDEPKIIFEDDHLLVLAKSSGWVVNRAESAKGPIVQDWLERRLRVSKEDEVSKVSKVSDTFSSRSGIVHRLDKETSGLLLVAKTPQAFENLTSQFADRKVKKRYLALVHGKLDHPGVIETPVGRLPWNRERFGVFAGGREAKTAYRALGYYAFPEDMYNKLTYYTKTKKAQPSLIFSLVELTPETGRTHQIRVHLKSIGHPVVSDEFYAGRKTARNDRRWCPRLFLHASYLGFFHPETGKWLEFNSELPPDLGGVLGKLGFKN